MLLIAFSYYVSHMKSIAVSSRLIAWATFAAAFLFIIGFSPVQTFAQTTPGSVQTGELIPPGQNTCQVVSITSIQPHIYGGVLESFDVTISDTSNSYVGALAQVGNTSIPLTFISRWAGNPSGLMIHVDTPDTPVTGVLPITLTLLSSPSNAPTCITTVSFAVSGSEVTQATQATGQPGSASQSQTAPISSTNSVPTHTQSTYPVSGGVSTSKHSTSTQEGTGLGTSTAAAAASISNSNFFSSVCSGNNAFRLWFVLLVIYVIIVAIVVFSEPWFLESSVIGSTAVILVPLILLLAFWYFSASCRAASWIPVVACIIAIIGLFLAFREYELPPLLPAPSDQ